MRSLTNIDLAKNELQNAKMHTLGTAPSSPVAGQVYYNSADGNLYVYDGIATAFVDLTQQASAPSDATTIAKGIVQLAGDLGGTGTVAAAPIISAGAIDTGKISGTLKPSGTAAVGTESLRALGVTASTACAGNDARLSDTRIPTDASVTGGTTGAGIKIAATTITAANIANATLTDVQIAAANKSGTAGTESLRQIGTGALNAMAGNTTLSSIAAPTTNVAMAGLRITGLGTPTVSTDATTKQYVDDRAGGFDWHESVSAIAIGNITLATPGATIDGVTLANPSRVLLAGQTTASENGIWIWTGAATALTRALDADAAGELSGGSSVYVEAGTTNADSIWAITTDGSITPGTTAHVWTQTSGLGQITAGTGLTKTGNMINAIGTASRISVLADSIDIDAAYAGQNTITTLGTITVGTWTGTSIAVANGGTGQTTSKAGRETGLAATGYYTSATHAAGTSITIAQTTHLLRASRGLVVQVQDEATGNVEEADVSVTVTGDVTVTVAVALTANTKRVTIVG